MNNGVEDRQVGINLVEEDMLFPGCQRIASCSRNVLADDGDSVFVLREGHIWDDDGLERHCADDTLEDTEACNQSHVEVKIYARSLMDMNGWRNGNEPA